MTTSSDNRTSTPGILVVDDDRGMLQSLGRALKTEWFGEVFLCAHPREVELHLETNRIHAVLLDLMMPDIPGETVLQMISDRYPHIPVIVLTAVDQVDTAVRCIKAGAFDYLVKPVDFTGLMTTLTRALRQGDVYAENLRLQDAVRTPQPKNPEHFAHIVTRSEVMVALFRYIEAIAPSREPVLIVGETGVGKELVARALHLAAKRPGAMVSINIAGIDENAFADTLFGHTKGAFTGADRDREGLIEQAGEGTLLLDEIGDLGPDIQTKLLRLLQEGEYFPLGSDRCHRSHCRILASTNRDLRARMQTGLFRQDLFYRLQGHSIRVPPLREHDTDIPLLAEHFVAEAAHTFGKPKPTVPRELAIHLSAYLFPGNIRELRAMIMDAVAQHDKGILSLAAFHRHMDRHADTAAKPSEALPGFLDGCLANRSQSLPTVAKATNLLIDEALKRTSGNQGAAARLLGISRRTVNRVVNRSRPDV